MPTPPPRCRVLVVDDEPLVLRAMGRLAGSLGAEVVPARGGDEALALLERMERLPDLIITELALPGIPGEELLRRVRRDPALAAIPVVAMSGTPTQEPFDLYLAKPFGAGEVRAALLLARAAGDGDGDGDPGERGGRRPCDDDDDGDGDGLAYGDGEDLACARLLLRPVDGRPGPARCISAADAARIALGALHAALA